MANLATNRQYTTFYLGERLYGIDVMHVQEVTKSLQLTPVRLAPPFVKGLINLRGQIATAIGLRELFGLGRTEARVRNAGDVTETEQMTVVCRWEGTLLSFLVDHIGEVMEVSRDSFETPPDTIEESVKKFMQGVYKIDGTILSVVGVDQILKEINRES